MTKKEKDAKKFAKNMVELEQHLGRDLRPDEVMLLALFASVVEASEEDEKDAENKAFHINGRRNGKDLFFKKIAALEQHFGRDLRSDETLLLMIFDSLKVDCEKEEDLFPEKINELVKRFGRKLRPDEAILLAMFDSIETTEEEKTYQRLGKTSWNAADSIIALSLLNTIFGVDPSSELKKAKDKNLLKEEDENE